MDHAFTGQWAEIRSIFRRALKAEGKPDTTIKAYTLSYDRLATWAAGAGGSSPEDLEAGHMDGFFAARYEQPGFGPEGKASPTTVAIDHRHLRRFFNWAVGRGIIEVSPMKGRKAPKVVEEDVPVIPDDQLTRLLATCASRTFADRRDTALLRLLFDAGIRHDEICEIETINVDRDRQIVTVIGKGGAKRDVPYGAKTAAAIDGYVLVRNKHKDTAMAWFWLASHPHRGKFGYDGLRLMLKRRWKQAGLTGRIFPHRFRHTAAHTQAAAGMSEGEMMYIFGWKDPSMPKRYGRSAAKERAIATAHKLSHADRI